MRNSKVLYAVQALLSNNCPLHVYISNTVLSTNTKYSPMLTTLKEINPIPVKTNTITIQLYNKTLTISEFPPCENITKSTKLIRFWFWFKLIQSSLVANINKLLNAKILKYSVAEYFQLLTSWKWENHFLRWFASGIWQLFISLEHWLEYSRSVQLRPAAGMKRIIQLLLMTFKCALSHGILCPEIEGNWC